MNKYIARNVCSLAFKSCLLLFTLTLTAHLISNEITLVNEINWIEENYPSTEYLMIIDGYQFASDYQKNLKETGYKVIYIDDLTQDHMYADIVINHSPSANYEQYDSEKYTKFALGLRYALLRPSCLRHTLSSIQGVNTNQ